MTNAKTQYDAARADQKAIDDAAAKITVLPAGPAKGVNKRTAPMTAHALKDLKKPAASKKPASKKPAANKAPAAKKPVVGNVITSAEIAAEQGISAKTLRARIRRNIDAWAPLFKDGEKHVFANNKATRSKITALLS